ncbi:MAG: tetratricopeptide repeat protein [Chthoniobacterales bacterium]
MNDDYQQPRSWRNFFAGVAVILVLFLLGASLAIIYGGPSIRNWRALQLSAKAGKLFISKDYVAAQQAAIAAYQLSPANPEVQRTVGKILAGLGHPQAIELYRALDAGGLANTQDQLFYAGLLVQQQDLTEAADVLQKVFKAEPENNEAHALNAKVLLMQGKFAESEVELRDILSKNPGNQDVLVLLGRLLAVSPDPAKRAEGVEILKKMAKSKEKAGLAALKYLLRIPQGDPAETREWMIAIENHPLSDEDARLLAADWEVHFDPSKSKEVYSRLMKEFGNAPPEQLRDFGGWLNQHQQYDLVLRLFSKDTALSRRDYFLIWLDAEAGLGEWGEVTRVLQNTKPAPPLEAPFISLFRGRAAAALNDPAQAALFYRKAITDAKRDAKIIWYLAGYFKQIGMPEYTKEALTLLLRSPTTARAGYQALLALAAQKRDTVAVVSILTEMHLRWPKDDSVENDQRFFSLLLGKATNQETEAQQLITQDPASLPFRTTLALLYLKQSKPKDALNVYKDLRVDWPQMNPELRAIYAAVLEANGMHDDAIQVASGITENMLYKQERDLLVSVFLRQLN